MVSFFLIILAATTISVIFYSNLHSALWRQKERFLQKCRAKTSPGQLSPGQPSFPTTNSTQIILEAAELGGVCVEERERDLAPLAPLAPVYIILPQHTPDLIWSVVSPSLISCLSSTNTFSETQVQVDNTFQTVEDDFFSTKF